MTTTMNVSLANVDTLPEVHRCQLKSLAEPWFSCKVGTPEEIFVLLGESYGESAAGVEVFLARITAEDDPELVLYDYWSDPGTGTGNYFYADTMDGTGGYEVQHCHEGVPLEETMYEARTRALSRRTRI
ncbi:hypothetical protein KV205_35320 [Streptomyces sp. SKN60]|uniref:hypothetical protein n=1 Tax=Streptomyces sp. SKN60 TaxID=2855506 RepID=UPI0022455079|nr:hypothetical protein [Streptomyces sp. SKN60]MCX2185735.1 hypothetical protein [Streptomyces sp. SKN60]